MAPCRARLVRGASAPPMSVPCSCCCNDLTLLQYSVHLPGSSITSTLTNCAMCWSGHSSSDWRTMAARRTASFRALLLHLHQPRLLPISCATSNHTCPNRPASPPVTLCRSIQAFSSFHFRISTRAISPTSSQGQHVHVVRLGHYPQIANFSCSAFSHWCFAEPHEPRATSRPTREQRFEDSRS